MNKKEKTKKTKSQTTDCGTTSDCTNQVSDCNKTTNQTSDCSDSKSCK